MRIRVFICPNCKKTRVVSKLLQAECFGCGNDMIVCKLPYSQWVELSLEEREKLVEEYQNHS